VARKTTKRKKPGPAPTGRLPFIGLKMSPELTARIDAWAEKHAIGRSEALRRLAEKALACESAQGATS
jgi:hypothetical protein